MIVKLRGEVEAVLSRLARAQAAGLPYEAYLHRLRLQDLLDTAGHHGVDPGTWVDRSELSPLTLDA